VYKQAKTSYGLPTKLTTLCKLHLTQTPK